MKVRLSSRSDSYKWTHFLQNRPGTKYISSYIEARGVEKGRNWKRTVMAGATYYLREYMSEPLVKKGDIERLERRMAKHGVSYNVEGWKHILDKHGGYAPVEIQAIPEGEVVPLRTPLVQLVNTDPAVPWIGGWLETQLLRAIWYPTTVATLSFHIKLIIARYMMETAGHTDGIDFKLHDFGARGCSSSETAQIGGAAHLFNFKGTDTFEAVEMLEEYYSEDMAGFSVDAAEHSTITSFGGKEHEQQAYEHIIKAFGRDNKLFSIVSDSYDLFGAINNIYGGPLKAQIQDLGKRGAKLVVRPDSGDPVTIVTDTILALMDKFGYTVNQKGFKVLPSYLGVLQGDGINEQSIEAILSYMKQNGLSAENIVFGMGGQLLQGVNRDTLKFAMKASAAKNETFNNGEWYDVVKAPKTDAGKASFGGRHAVLKFHDFGTYYQTVKEEEVLGRNNILLPIYKDGKILKLETLADIRQRVAEAL